MNVLVLLRIYWFYYEGSASAGTMPQENQIKPDEGSIHYANELGECVLLEQSCLKSCLSLDTLPPGIPGYRSDGGPGNAGSSR